jgi:hypothetical protein
VQRLLTVAEEIIGRGDRHEHQADGEQHLIQVWRAIQATIKRAFQHDTRQRRHDHRDRKRGEERHTKAVEQDDADVAT